MRFLTALPCVNPLRTVNAVFVEQLGDAFGELKFPARVGRVSEIIFDFAERRLHQQRLQFFHEAPRQRFGLDQASTDFGRQHFSHQTEKKRARKRQFQIGGNALLAGEFEFQPLGQTLGWHDDLFRAERRA